MECAFFGVPTVVIYKASWSNYWLAKQFLKVKFLAMPNLLGNEEIYPELIQQEATAERIADEALKLLNDASGRSAIKSKLRTVIQSLGPPGASFRAAQAIVNLLVWDDRLRPNEREPDESGCDPTDHSARFKNGQPGERIA